MTIEHNQQFTKDQGKSVAKTVQSANLTGGKGFTFEDKVGAWFVVHLLAGVTPFTDKPGTLQQLAFQTEPDGWMLDDLLLTCKDGNTLYRYAISIKSNRQFSASKAPKDFVERCWQQFLRINSHNSFSPETDQLVNITAELPSTTKDSVSSLLNAASVRNSEEMVKQLANGDLSKNARAMFHSFTCPAELAKQHQIEIEKIPELLRCVRVLPLDLENLNSRDKTYAISLCRHVLKTEELQIAKDLWESLLVLVNRHRVDRGHIDLFVVLQALRHRFQLKDHPDFTSDWQRLWLDSKVRWQSVIDNIGGKTRFPRENILQTIKTKFADHQVIVLLGEQGVGKSVVARRWVEARPQSEPILWLSPKTLEISDLPELRERLKLEHSWSDLIPSFAQKQMTVVLDGLERLLLRSESMVTVGQILHSLLVTSGIESSFNILLTCQEQAWGEVQFALLQADIDAISWPQVLIEPVNSEELSALVTDFPSLHALSVHDRLKTILRKPKILDCITRSSRINKLPDVRNWAGESDVIDWVWKVEIIGKQQATARQRLMWELAERQAERFSVDVPLDDLNNVVDIALDSLISDQICLCIEGRVSFSHDLWADWARQRLLLAHETELPTYLIAKLDNPTWHRAIVLFGLDILERQNHTDSWLVLMNRSDILQNKGTLICDLLLESLIHAAQTTDAFNRAWSQLSADDGKWLRRLLVRFLHIATSPNSVMLRYAKSKKGLSETWASSVNRLPKPAFWKPMLQFLNTHQQECVDLAPLQVAEISERWLCWTEASMALRNEAADLAVAVAWQSLRYQQHRRFSDYSNRRNNRGDSETIAKKAYSAALQAIQESPEEVIDFALCACGCSEPTAPLRLEPQLNELDIQSRPLTPELEELINYESPWREYEIEIPAWSEGPRWSVDDIFRKICLQEFGLTRLINQKPDKAAEIILALIIREGGTRLPENDFAHSEYHYELKKSFSWFPPFYDKGPFHYFLNTHPEIGLDIIIKLVNFSTERWLELQKWRAKNEKGSELFPDEQMIFDIRVPFENEEQIWIGNRRWFFSFRDSTEAPDILVSALMALEKWLYDLLDTNQDVEYIITDVLTRTRSLALVGLLIGVGKKETKLLIGPLLPFLAVIEIYDFDLTHIIKDEMHQMVGWGIRHTLEQVETAAEWHRIEHRKEQLEHVVFKMLLTTESLQEYFNKVRLEWRKRLDLNKEADPQHDLLLRLYHQFNLENWRHERNEDNNIVIHFEEPTEMLGQRNKNTKLYEDRQAILYFPFRCREVIDGEKVITESEFEKLWEKGEYLFGLDFTEIFDKQPLVSKEDLACGIIAVATCKFRSWLKSRENQEPDCLNTLIQVVNNPPPRQEFDVANSVKNTGWDSFCADALPIFWGENQKSSEIRQAICSLVFNLHYETVSRLFKQVTLIHVQLGDDYPRLLHLLLRWSVIRYRFDVLNGQLFGEESASREELLAEVDELMQQFIGKLLPASVPRWKTLDHTFVDNRPSLCATDHFGRKIYYPRSPGIDFQLIRLSYGWITDLDNAANETERSHWLEFWEQAVDTVCWMLGEANSEIEEIDGTPYEFERWLFKQLPLILVSTRTSEEAEKLWRPILELGAPAHYWLDNFLNDWWCYGFPNDPDKQLRFISIWKQMWIYTVASSKWGESQSKGSWHMSKIDCALIGLGEITLAIDFWDETKDTLVQSLEDEFRIWCEYHLSDVDCARSFIIFLLIPAAHSLKALGLEWLDKAIEKHGFWHERPKRIDTQLAELLDNCKDLVKSDNDTRNVFFRLLRILVERQEPLALTIQDRL